MFKRASVCVCVRQCTFIHKHTHTLKARTHVYVCIYIYLIYLELLPALLNRGNGLLDEDGARGVGHNGVARVVEVAVCV